LRHAARVRSLRVLRNEYFHLLRVLSIDSETCAFPGLLALEWEPDNINGLPLFLSPTLRRCILSVVHPALKSIGTRCHGLEILSFGRSTERAHDDPSLLSDMIRSCTRLKHLRCIPLDYAAWNHLSNTPTLLTVNICGGLNRMLLDRDNVNFAPFRNITALHADVISAADMITVIRHSEFPSLREFFFMSACALPWAELLRALTQCKACDTLENIFISSRSPDIGCSHDLLTTIRQLRCFLQLRTLRLFVNYPISLDNEFILEVMSGCPRIHSLTLWDSGPHPSVITFRGLFAALRLCPHLDYLHVELDAVNIDIDPGAESFQHTSLRKLNVGSSPVQDPKTVAHIISSAFPDIFEVIDGRSTKGWSEVNGWLWNLRYQ
jgi:hypothetical protein